MNEPVSLLDQWRLVKRASTDTRLSKGDVAVLTSILDRMKGGVAWPSIATVAADARVDRRTAARSIAKLVGTDYLSRESGDRVRSNRYRIGIAGRGTAATTGSGAHAPTGSGTAATGVGAATPLQVVAGLPPELAYKNPPIEPTQKHTRKAQAPAGRFAEFYAVYPRHEKRSAAEKSWKRQKLDAVLGSIIADVQARLAEGGPWRGTEKRFIPLPATYLNDRRWEDEWTPAGPANGKLARDSRSDDEIAAANEAALARFGGGP